MEATAAHWSSNFTKRSEIIKAPLQESFHLQEQTLKIWMCFLRKPWSWNPDLLLNNCGGERLQLQQLLC